MDGQSALAPSKKRVPPPGAYDPDYRKAIPADPQFSMKGRHADSAKLKVPGPGTYNSSLSNKQAAPRYGFGSSQRANLAKKTLSPGPGGYKIPCTIGNLPSFAMPGGKEEFRFV